MITDERFSKSERLVKSKDFRAVYNKGISFKKGPFILYCAANGLTHNRIGMSISARNVKLAAGRNRIKRVFREVYRKTKTILRPGADIIMIAKKSPDRSFTYAEAEKVFLKLAKEARLVK